MLDRIPYGIIFFLDFLRGLDITRPWRRVLGNGRRDEERAVIN